jgi:hypothetical protein
MEKELKGVNINWLSRQAARVVASVLVMGIGCLLASCDEGGRAPALQSINCTVSNGGGSFLVPSQIAIY